MSCIFSEFFNIYFERMGFNIDQILLERYKIFNLNVYIQAKLGLVNKRLYYYYKDNLLPKEKFQKSLQEILTKQINLYGRSNGYMMQYQSNILPHKKILNMNIKYGDKKIDNEIHKFLGNVKYDKIIKILPITNLTLLSIFYSQMGYPIVVRRIIDTDCFLEKIDNDSETSVTYSGRFFIHFSGGNFFRNFSFIPENSNLDYYFKLTYGQLTLYEGNNLPKNILLPFIWNPENNSKNLELTISSNIQIKFKESTDQQSKSVGTEDKSVGPEDKSVGPEDKSVGPSRIRGWLCYDVGILEYDLRNKISQRLCLQLNCCTLSETIKCENPNCIKYFMGKIYKSKKDKENLINIINHHKNLEYIFGTANPDIKPYQSIPVYNNYILVGDYSPPAFQFI